MLTQNPSQKFVNFSLTPQKNCRDQRMPTGLTPQKRLWGHPSEKFIQRGGGALNGMSPTPWGLYLEGCGGYNLFTMNHERVK
jgi:hypothetical protein